MKDIRKDLLLYAVTDRSWLRGGTLYHQVRKLLNGGVTFVQLREKELDEESFLLEARKIRELCGQYKVPFVINDNVEIAVKVDADGVHVGQGDMEAGEVRRRMGADKIVGVSVQTVEQALLAQHQGADYLGVGAVFPTDSKTDAANVSLETLRAICTAVEIPVIAIGGIGPDNVMELTGSGICGIAVISALFARPELKAAARELKSLTEKMLRRDGNGKRTALTIAGTDPSGGAGIQADIKTMLANGVYAMSVVTALVAQNTTQVTGIMEVTPRFLEEQLDNVFTDIRPDAVKIGMVSAGLLIDVIAERLEWYQAEHIVVDPVMVATNGAKLISDEAVSTLKERLFPMADILTPNIPEAEILSGMTIRTKEDMIAAARAISSQYSCAVLCKGGHDLNDADDLLYRDGSYRWFCGKRIYTVNTHGTGCTLSSAIASNLSKGFDLDTSVERAKAYISGALGAMLDLGKGRGPMDHGFDLTGEFI